VAASAVGRAGLGEPVGGQQQRRAGWEGEPVDGRGFGGEFGETERDAGAEGRRDDGGVVQQLRRNVTAVDDLYLFVRVDVDDEASDEPFVVAGLRGVGVVPYDRGTEGIDERGQGGLSVAVAREAPMTANAAPTAGRPLSRTSPIRVPHGETTTS
jgi:hypothetical protein